jgi:putative SOS response-associated peptidase YedK
MCGRFASARKRAELLEEFRIERDRVTDSLAPDYNVAPTKKIYAVLNRGPRASEQASEEGVARELRVVRWGLVPSWAKDPSIGSRMINARAETVASKPSFRGAFAKRRCLLPADGFYEWVSVTEAGKSRKQPYYIHRADGGPLAFAGLYELWRDSSQPDDSSGAWLWTAVIITTQAEDEVGQIHERTPMIVDPSVWGDWLDPASNDASSLHALLTPAASTKLETYPVAMDVNSVRNNGPGLIRPLVPAAGSGGGNGAGGDGASGGRGGPGGSRPGEDGGPRDRHRHLATAPLTLF